MAKQWARGSSHSRPEKAAGPQRSQTRASAPQIVDRLTFNGTIIETGTGSYRLAQTRAQQAGKAR
ncbi:hypothetical protein Lfu02_77470 [Longispora fulva]|nr:hypothetical protein Lfu02_77470 [Longispora fulva]